MRAIGYIRVSTDHQASDGVSLAAQETKLRAYALAMDMELVAVEADAASAKTLDRPGLAHALAALDRGEADALLIVKLDRLTRSLPDLAALLSGPFAPGRASLVSMGDSIDTSSAAGRLVLNVLMSVAQWEREAIAERTRDALSHLAAQGVRLGRDAYGWTRTEDRDADGRRIVADLDAELATVERIRALRRSGLTLRQVADELQRAGVATKRGGAWHASTVRAVLRRAGEL